MTFQKSVDDLLNDIAEACGPSLFSQKEVEDFLDYCLCALRDCPEELRERVRACWRRTDDATDDGETFALLLWEGSVWVMTEAPGHTTRTRNRWMSWPQEEDHPQGAAVVLLDGLPPPDRSATIEGERIGDAVDDLEATGMWLPKAAAYGTTRYVYRGDFPQDDPERFDIYDDEPIENPGDGDADGVVDLTERRRSRNRAKLESVLASTAATMAEDPGFQAAVRKSAAERKMGEHAAGAQLFQPKDKVRYCGHDGLIPKTWKGRIVEHEWHDWGDGPEHHYIVKWTTPAGAKHEGLYNQCTLEAAR